MKNKVKNKLEYPTTKPVGRTCALACLHNNTQHSNQYTNYTYKKRHKNTNRYTATQKQYVQRNKQNHQNIVNKQQNKAMQLNNKAIQYTRDIDIDITIQSHYEQHSTTSSVATDDIRR